MADNDIFRARVPRAFRQASRDVIRYGQVERGVSRAIQAIDAISAEWTRADIKLAQRIHRVALLPGDLLEERNLHRDAIDEIVGQEQSDLVRSIAKYAKETMPAATPEFEAFFILATARFTREQIEVGRIVAEAAFEYDRPIEAITHDVAAFERELFTSSEFQAKVREIARSPGTGQIRRIQPKLDLEALLVTPITELAS